MDGTNARAGQHGKSRLGNHRHVDQYAVAFFDAQRLQTGGHALHFVAQVGKGVGFFGAGFAGNSDQRGLGRAVFKVPVYSVVAQVGQAAFIPFGKRWVVVVADAVKRLVPFDQVGLFGPEGIGLVNGLAVKVGVTGHGGFRFL